MAHFKSNNKQIIKLHDYQKPAFRKLIIALKKTFRALMVMATGLGKTILSIEVVKYFSTPEDKVLFLCHDNGILNNAYKKYKQYFGNEYTYTKFYGRKKDWEADKHNFVFATFQSVFSHLQNEKVKMKLFSPKHFKFIVVDESHHSQAGTFAEVINYFKPMYKLGMTATPDREDEADIRDIFGKEVVKILLPEAIAKGWLTPVDYKVLSDGLDMNKISQICKEVLADNIRLTEKQVNEKIFIKIRTKEQARIIQKYSSDRKAIVFCQNIEHVEHVSRSLPSSVVIHSKQHTDVNDANFELFEQGHVRHVLVVDKLNEGIDVPEVELLGFLRNTDSERIFLQQLGRGLRISEGKEKVIVLDFVSNIDRIKQVAKLALEIERITGVERLRNNITFGDALHVEGKGFKFDFSDQVVNLLSVFEKLNEDFYPTWQEATKKIVALGIKSTTEYKYRYKEDPRLHSNPQVRYSNFPGWDRYFGRKPKTFYPTWKQASNAAVRLKIKVTSEYHKRYQENKRLPYDPGKIYKDFPGFKIFLGGKEKDFYKTWRQAAKAAKKLGVNGNHAYKKVFRKDKKLPSHPETFYKDFPGWSKFFGKKKKVNYKTCNQASNAAKKLGITSVKRYPKEYTKDPLLPSNPAYLYPDFPGWSKFLQRK